VHKPAPTSPNSDGTRCRLPKVITRNTEALPTYAMLEASRYCRSVIDKPTQGRGGTQALGCNSSSHASAALLVRGLVFDLHPPQVPPTRAVLGRQ
jgi:hypothetical protein